MDSETNKRISEPEKINYLEIAIQEFQQGNFLKAVEIYRKAIQHDPELMKQGIGISYSHAMILATDWEEISRNLPSGINYLESSGWLNSLWAGTPLNQNFCAIPWYTYPAIEFLENKIDQNWKIFEFGSGQSTLWWAERVTEVISLENDQNWFSYIQGNMPTNVSLYLEENETEYATKISNYPDNYFDIVIIDGANRNECAKFTLNKVKDKGFIIFDNTDNHEFNLGVNLLLDNGYQKIDFYGLIPGYTYKNCTSIFFKDFAILSDRQLPSEKQSCLGLSCFQVTNPQIK